MEPQAVAQFQSPEETVRVDLVAGHHLRLRRPIGVDAVQRVEDEIGVVAGRPVEGDDRIEHREIRSRHEGQGLGLVGPRDARGGENRSGGQTGIQKIAAAHRCPSPIVSHGFLA